MGTGTIRRHYAGYDNRQMGRIEDQPRERILEAYYAERDRVKRLESEFIALGKAVPPRDGETIAATGDATPPGTLGQGYNPDAPPAEVHTPVTNQREAEELARIKHEAEYPLKANEGNEVSRHAELLPGQDPTDAEPSQSEAMKDVDLDEAKRAAEHPTGTRRKK